MKMSASVADGLKRRGIDVTTTVEAGLMAATDNEQLEFALNQVRVLFTQDADFLKLHRVGAKHAGIVYCRQCRRSIGEILRGLVLIWELLEAEEMVGNLEFL